jgi:hypothetical protein
MYTSADEQFRDQNLNLKSIQADGIALLPIVGANKTFTQVVTKAADSLFKERDISNYSGNRQVANDLNNANMVSTYQEMINHYQSSGIIDKKPLNKIGEATGKRYLFKIQIGALQNKKDTETSYLSGNVESRDNKDVRISGLIWDASNGNLVWEGSSTAKAFESDLTIVSQKDKEFYEAATEEMINKILQSKSE